MHRHQLQGDLTEGAVASELRREGAATHHAPSSAVSRASPSGTAVAQDAAYASANVHHRKWLIMLVLSEAVFSRRNSIRHPRQRARNRNGGCGAKSLSSQSSRPTRSFSSGAHAGWSAKRPFQRSLGRAHMFEDFVAFIRIETRPNTPNRRQQRDTQLS